MELDYFINESGIKESLIARKLLDSGSLYSYLNNTTSTNNYDLLVNEDFSLFICFDIYKHSQYKSQQIVSNFNILNQNGLIIGLLSSGYLFVKCPKSKFSAIFNDIMIGERNTLCFQKSGNSISIIQYDNFSKAIHKSQSILLPSDYLNSGLNYFLCGTESNENSTDPLLSKEFAFGNINFIQLLCLNNSVEERVANILFQGFLPYTKLESSTSDFFLVDQSKKTTDLIPINYLSYINDLDNLINSGILDLINSGLSGEFGVEFNAVLQSGVMSVFSSELYELEDFCTSGLPVGSLLEFSGTPSFSKNINIKIYLNRQNSDANVSAFYSIDNSKYVSSIDSLWRSDYLNNEVSFSENSFFYDTFLRNGVLLTNFTSLQNGTLKTIPSVAPKNYNLYGIYDSINNGFVVSDENSTFYLDGEKITSYTIDSNFLTLTSGDSTTGQLIYDIFTGEYDDYGNFISLKKELIREFSSIVFNEDLRIDNDNWIEVSELMPFYVSTCIVNQSSLWNFN